MFNSNKKKFDPLGLRFLRHYVLNKNNQAGIFVLKYRKHFVLQIFYFIRTIIYKTRIFGTEQIENINVISFVDSFNQLKTVDKRNNLIAACDSNLIKRAHQKVVDLRIPTFQYIKTYIIIFSKIWKNKNRIYIDKIAYNIVFINNTLKKLPKVEKVLVCNLNNDLVLSFVSLVKYKAKIIHLPHSIIGDTCLPYVHWADEFHCSGQYDIQKVLSNTSYPANKLKIITKNKRNAGYKKRSNKNCVLYLPKDINILCFKELRIIVNDFEKVFIKVHPNNGYIKTLITKYIIKKKLRKSVKYSSHTDALFYCAASTSVFEILGKGNPVFRLPTIPICNDYYGFDKLLIEHGTPANSVIFNNQLRQFEYYNNEIGQL